MDTKKITDGELQEEPRIDCPHWAPGRLTKRRRCTACAADQARSKAERDAFERARDLLQKLPSDRAYKFPDFLSALSRDSDVAKLVFDSLWGSGEIQYSVDGLVRKPASAPGRAEANLGSRSAMTETSTDPTPDEARAIASLKRLAGKWPKTLTLASMGGSLVVVHTRDERFDHGGALERQEAVLADISGIPNTGGDW